MVMRFWQTRVLSKVERANNLDVGMRGDTSLVSYQVNLFYNEIENFAYLRNLGYEIEGLTAYQYTQQKARCTVLRRA